MTANNPIKLTSGYVSFYEVLENNNMHIVENKAVHDEAKLIAHALESSNFSPENFPNVDWASYCSYLIDQGIRSSIKLGIDPYMANDDPVALHNQSPLICTEFGDCFIKSL